MLITVSTHKGGSGKTFVATNIAACLSELFPEKSVLLIDLDGQCGISTSFGKDSKNFVDQSILSIINQTKQISQVINDIKDNFSIIYSEPNMKGFDHIINNNVKVKDNLIKVLNHLKSKFDYVIIDTPPTFSSINICAFLVSDLVICPFEAERQNIEGALNVVKELKKEIYTNQLKVYFVPNKIKDWLNIDNSLLKYFELQIANESNAIMSRYKILDSIQNKQIVAYEKLPLFLSKQKTPAIIKQKTLFIQIVKDILLKATNEDVVVTKSNEQLNHNLKKVLNKNYDQWLEKINERYSKKSK